MKAKSWLLGLVVISTIAVTNSQDEEPMGGGLPLHCSAQVLPNSSAILVQSDNCRQEYEYKKTPSAPKGAEFPECRTIETLLQAIAYVQGGNGRIHGNITFSQNDGGTVTIWGKILGLPPGRHGFHVHETGDITSSCSSTGAHYNPFKKKHGALTDPERHVGDLGSIVASPDGVALVSITDNVISLTGPYTILGRSIVVHADPDDSGKGGFPDSLKTGHAGARIACGVIGLLTPLERLYETSSAVSVYPWKSLILPVLAIVRLNY